LAALAHVTESSATDYYRVNVIGAEALLRALASLDVPPERVVLASSANIYGNCLHSPISEDEPPAPVNHYGASKLAMEHIARTYRTRLPIVITRPFNYTGVGQSESFLVPKIVAHFARRAGAIKLGNIDVSRDFSDVRFVAAAYERLLDAPKGDGAPLTVNLCSGRSVSVRAIIGMLTEISGHRLRVETDAALVRANDILELRGSDARLRALAADLPVIPLRDTLDWMHAAHCG
jgi:nucleoside-diphosphate-sugar epimerase